MAPLGQQTSPAPTGSPTHPVAALAAECDRGHAGRASFRLTAREFNQTWRSLATASFQPNKRAMPAPAAWGLQAPQTRISVMPAGPCWAPTVLSLLAAYSPQTCAWLMFIPQMGEPALDVSRNLSAVGEKRWWNRSITYIGVSSHKGVKKHSLAVISAAATLLLLPSLPQHAVAGSAAAAGGLRLLPLLDHLLGTDAAHLQHHAMQGSTQWQLTTTPSMPPKAARPAPPPRCLPAGATHLVALQPLCDAVWVVVVAAHRQHLDIVLRLILHPASEGGRGQAV